MFRLNSTSFRQAVRKGFVQQRYHSGKPRPSVKDPSRPMEEETLLFYNPEDFYPAHIGETFRSEYKVVGKLGYGAHSTSWLCKNLKKSGFATVKVCTRNPPGVASAYEREYRAYEQLSRLTSLPFGSGYIRELYDTFDIKGPHGEHSCFVLQPMHLSMQEFQEGEHDERCNRFMMNLILHHLLHVLQFLHEDAKIIHTDIHAGNIMFQIRDKTVLKDFAQAELDDPSPAKFVNATRSIYTSRRFRRPMILEQLGHPFLCDYGCARLGAHHEGLAQPELYRAPEMLFKLPWSYSADIWNLGVFIWDVVENRTLFDPKDDDPDVDAANYHSAEMVAYLGNPPKEFVQRGDLPKGIFTDEGQWKDLLGVKVPQTSLEEAVTFFEETEKREFLDFLKMMLRWIPEERASARQLLASPWMMRVKNEMFGY